MSEKLFVFRDILGKRQLVGEIDTLKKRFCYDSAYRMSDNASALSFSLPLRETSFEEHEFRPYFEGLLPEGAALRALAEDLGAREEDYLGILALCGSDCIGDVVIEGSIAEEITLEHEPLSLDDLKNLFARPATIASSSVVSRLSLAGTQSKVGLYHNENCSMREGWSRPIGGAPSTHIMKAESYKDLAIVEYLSLSCAKACGLNTPDTQLLNFGKPVLCSKRYDRFSVGSEQGKRIQRLHQEDITQAFGILPGSKYAELEPSTTVVIAEFFKKHSFQPLQNIQAYVRLVCFNYAIGNCDNHLKNLSLLYSKDLQRVAFAPAYDIVATCYYERFSRDMAMRIGNSLALDEVSPQDFVLFAKEVGVSLSLIQKTGQFIIDNLIPSLRGAAKGIAPDFPVAPYIADDLEEEIFPRLEVLKGIL